MDFNNFITGEWKNLSRGEIISRLQHLPHHSPKAAALRAAYSMLKLKQTDRG
jgi:hypothetical protein